MMACREGKTGIVDMYMKENLGDFDLSHKSEDHWTPLLYASLNSHSRVIERLVHIGVDIN